MSTQIDWILILLNPFPNKIWQVGGNSSEKISCFHFAYPLEEPEQCPGNWKYPQITTDGQLQLLHLNFTKSTIMDVSWEYQKVIFR